MILSFRAKVAVPVAICTGMIAGAPLGIWLSAVVQIYDPSYPTMHCVALGSSCVGLIGLCIGKRIGRRIDDGIGY